MVDLQTMIFLSEECCNNLDHFFDFLEVDIKGSGTKYWGKCPAHLSDNPHSFALYNDGIRSFRGRWLCFTNKCEQKWGKGIFGLVKGIMWTKHNKVLDDGEIAQLIAKFLNIDPSTLRSRFNDKDFIAKNKLVKLDSTLNKEVEEQDGQLTREQVRQLLKIPSPYYVDRQFSPSVLDSYDVGLCSTYGKFLYNRSVFPVYNISGNRMIGCCGRSIFEECPKCCLYHKEGDCPPSYMPSYAKWLNSTGFIKSAYLFNLWKARPYIENSRTVILVEGKADILKLVESGIENCLAIFGSSLSDQQQILLERLGIWNLVSLLDNDKAGQEGYKKIKEEIGHIYNVYKLEYNAKDLGEMTVGNIKENLFIKIREIEER